jgi:hypothetical protein
MHGRSTATCLTTARPRYSLRSGRFQSCFAMTANEWSHAEGLSRASARLLFCSLSAGDLNSPGYRGGPVGLSQTVGPDQRVVDGSWPRSVGQLKAPAQDARCGLSLYGSVFTI